MHELKPGGATIAVTEENKREYVKLYVNYRFMRGIEQQFLSLQKGENCAEASASVTLMSNHTDLISFF